MSFISFSSNDDRTLQLYSGAYVFIDNRLLTQEASVSLEKKSNSNPTYTLGMGFAGLSLGAGTVEIMIEMAVPAKDFEFAPDAYVRTGSVIEVGVVMAGNQSIFKGFIQEASYRHSANEASKMTMKCICRYADFE